MVSKSQIILFLFLVGATTILLVFLFSLGENESTQEKKLTLRNQVYSHLDKLCRDVNSLDKIQIAIYFLMQSWMTMCDTTPNTIVWAPLKLMKKKIHSAVTKRIHDFNIKEERSVEDCIIEYYKTEIIQTKDDFHQMLLELILQGYVNTFHDKIDQSDENLKMQTINCNNSITCQYTFKKPPPVSKMFDKIVKKSVDEIELKVRERKCVQLFHYLYLWNEKIRHPESFDWAYYLLFRGLQTSINATVEEVKQHLQCSSNKMEQMEEAMKEKEDEVQAFMLDFLRERDVEIEILEEEVEYATEPEKHQLDDQLNLENVLAELLIKTYMTLVNIVPDDGKIVITSATGKPYEIEVPPMDRISLL